MNLAGISSIVPNYGSMPTEGATVPRFIISSIAAMLLAFVPGPASASQNAVATGAVTFGDGASLNVAAVSFASGVAGGLITYRPQPGPASVAILVDCMAFTPGGNLTTIGGDLFASGVDATSSQRYYLRLTDQFGQPGTLGAFVAVSTTAGTEPAQCLAEDLRGEPISAGDFLFVRPAS